MEESRIWSSSTQELDRVSKQFVAILAGVALGLLVFSLFVGCDKVETPVSFTEAEFRSLVINWTVAESSGEPMVSAVNGTPSAVVTGGQVLVPQGRLPRSQVTVRRLAASPTQALGQASFFDSALPRDIALSLGSRRYRLEAVPVRPVPEPRRDSLSVPALFLYPLPVPNSRIEWIELGQAGTTATVELSGFSLTDNRLSIPPAVRVLSPAAGTAVPRNADLVVRIEGTSAMSTVATLTPLVQLASRFGNVPDTFIVSPLVSSVRSLVKEFARGATTLTFTPAELSQLPSGLVLLNVASADVRLVNGGQVSLVGQSTASVSIELRSDAVRESVGFSLAMPQTVSRSGDTLSGEFKVQNRSSVVQVFQFPTACQLGLNLKRGEQAVLVQPELCAQVQSSLSVAPNDTRSLSFRLPLRDQRTGAPLPAGEYVLEAFLLNGNSPVLRQTVRVESN